jgi:hypothetical protein
VGGRIEITLGVCFWGPCEHRNTGLYQQRGIPYVCPARREQVSRTRGVFRNDLVYVCAKMCETCIFRPGNLMDLQPGRVEQMVKDATAANSCIPCHKTTYRQNHDGEAVCRGFFEQHSTPALQIAERMGLVKYQ